MAPKPSPLESTLARSLTRMTEALAHSDGQASLKGPGLARSTRPDVPSLGSLLGAGAFILAAAVTQIWWLVIPAVGLGVFGGLTIGQRLGARRLTRGGTRAHIGMGADVAADAVVEPGAAVEMGASVHSGAVIQRGAVVRMGATVQANAVVETGAVVSWGATVHSGAVVGRGSVIGAGSDVQAGARVAPDTTVWPGTTLHAAAGRVAPGSVGALPSTVGPAEFDPRANHVRAVCDRLEAELREAPDSMRSFLGDPATTVAALRRSCEDLLVRERALRAESEPQALTHLDDERRSLLARISKESDEPIRRSLSGAVAAIDEQKRQRELLRKSADRLEAEQTRLLYTLEGMAAQFVRLRTVGDEARQGATGALEQSVEQLKAALEAITSALEEVSRPTGSTLMAIAPVSGEVEPVGDRSTKIRGRIGDT